MTKQEKITFLKELKTAINENTDFSCTYPIDEAIENFIWVSTKDERIGNLACHYEVLFYSKGCGVPTDVPFVEVHFESATYKNFQGIELPEWLTYDNWSNRKERRIIYTDGKEECSTEAVIKRLKKLEKCIGQDLRAAFDSQIPKADTNTEQEDAATPGTRTIKDNAKWYANFRCEINPDHETFVTEGGINYMEAHHLIPPKKWVQAEFENSLEQEQNLVCLCPNCHREIHHGMNKLELVETLWEQRKKKLKAAGIGVTLSKLREYYS